VIDTTILELPIDQLETRWERIAQNLGVPTNRELDRPVTVQAAQFKEMQSCFYAALGHARGDTGV
jgi:hypothetical protein